MSVVLAVCGENYVKMISDGRVVLFSDEGESTPVNEHYNKLKRLNEHVILGFAGDKTVCEKIAKKLKLSIAKLPKNSVDLLECAKNLQQISQSAKLGALKVHFILGGVSHNSEMGLCVLNSSTGFQIESYYPNHGQHLIKVSFPFGCQQTCDELVDKCFNANFTKTPELLDNQMMDFVNDIADIDNTVNKNHYKIEIIKTQG